MYIVSIMSLYMIYIDNGTIQQKAKEKRKDTLI